MNKKVLLVVAIVIWICGALSVVFLLNGNPNDVGEFELSDYQSFTNRFASNATVDAIDNAKVAKKQAEKLWVERFGEYMKDLKPYRVFYDSANDVWLVMGTLPKMTLGGVPYVLIQTDGRVLAMWAEK